MGPAFASPSPRAALALLQLRTCAALLTLLLLHPSPSSAVYVAPDSPCETSCGNVLTSTSPDDVVCGTDYTTAAGIVWKSCLSCELSSSYSTTVDGANYTDLGALLYNMRYATSYCIFDNVNATSDNGDHSIGDNPCSTSRACQAFESAFEYKHLATDVEAYGYCSEWLAYWWEDCNNCLGELDGGYYFQQYLAVLNDTCGIQPEPGLTLNVHGTLFSTGVVSVSAPTPTGSYDTGPAGPLGLGAIVGVAIGGAVALLVVAGFVIVLNGKRKRRAYLRQRERQFKNNGWPSPSGGGGGEMFETEPQSAVSQRPLRGWDNDSPVSAATGSTYPRRQVSPYSPVQHASPVSAADGQAFGYYGASWPPAEVSPYGSPTGGVESQHQNSPWAQAEASRNIGVAFSNDEYPGDHHLGGDSRKGKERAAPESDGFELQEVANSSGGYPGYAHEPIPHDPPMLRHPGYGRAGDPRMHESQAPDDRFI